MAKTGPAPSLLADDAPTVQQQTRIESQGVPLARDMALVPAESASVVQMFERLARDPEASVEKIERLMALWERNEERRAKQSFNRAMSAAQKKMKAVVPDAYNPQTKSKYASYEALDEAIRPVYTEHGFGLSFDTADTEKPETVRVLCYASHADGFERVYHIDMPADGKGAKGADVMTKTHATGSACSYGQRYLLRMIFNMSVEKDDDGNRAGGHGAKPEPPQGYGKWGEQMKAAANRGLEAFEPAWECSDGAFKTYAMNHDREAVKQLRATAASKGQGR